MSEAEFDFLRAILRARSGLSLTREKRYLVRGRLAPVCARLGLASIEALLDGLRSSPDPEIERRVVEAMTTNETSFFRDRAPFNLLRDVVLPRAMAARAGSRHLRIWCAACSTGQEPYSLAILLRESAPLLSGWSVDILATDLSIEVLEKARAGLYSQFEVQRGLPVGLLLKYFAQVDERWEVAASIRSMVEFRPFNLIEPFDEIGTFDVILCRNVLIYFDAPTRGDVLGRLARALNPDGVVMLGADETVIGLSDALAPHPRHRGLYVASPAADAPVLRLVASR